MMVTSTGSEQQIGSAVDHPDRYGILLPSTLRQGITDHYTYIKKIEKLQMTPK